MSSANFNSKDFYENLGVPRNADLSEIKKAYKKLSLKHHPDRNPNNPEATAKFQEVGKAFATLSDPEKRKRYDQFGVIDGENDGNGGMPAGMNPFDMCFQTTILATFEITVWTFNIFCFEMNHFIMHFQITICTTHIITVWTGNISYFVMNCFNMNI